jgi:hypothetical protein
MILQIPMKWYNNYANNVGINRWKFIFSLCKYIFPAGCYLINESRSLNLDNTHDKC